MSDIDDDSEIFFTVKFLGRIQVVRPGGMQILTDAVEALKDPNIEMVHPSQPKILGFVAKHPAADMYHCYIFQSKKFSHLLVSIIGDSFRAYKQNEGLQGDRDMVVEALRHKNKVLERENAELKRRLQANGEVGYVSDYEAYIHKHV